MGQWLEIFGGLIGGLGLFLLAVNMITDGLKLAAGQQLRGLLASSTRTTARGVFSGVLLTALVQSSSAVTVATIGFVNAGLLGIAQALAIVLGAAVGTTITGWLVSVVGFEFKIALLALPLVGLGMLLRLFGPSKRLGALGEAIAGFGLFFIAVDFLRHAFDGLATGMDIAALAPAGVLGVLLFVLIGLLMTLLTQSSSAAIAITLTAASGGLIGMAAALAMVIGATIGTTSTSALAAIGATPNARRVAAGHVIINGFNGLVGLALLAPLLTLLGATDHLGEVRLAPAPVLAAFHTIFTLVGGLLLWRSLRSIGHWLEGRFQSQAEALGRPQYLDANVLASPTLALDAFLLELRRMAALARVHAGAAIGMAAPPKTLALQQRALKQLVAVVEESISTLETERLTAVVANQLPLVLRISSYIDEMLALAQEVAAEDLDLEQLLRSPLGPEIADFQAALRALVGASDPELPGFSPGALATDYEALHQQWRTLKTALLNAGIRHQVPVTRLNPAIEALRAMLRMAERCTKVATRLAELASASASASVLETENSAIPAAGDIEQGN